MVISGLVCEPTDGKSKVRSFLNGEGIVVLDPMTAQVLKVSLNLFQKSHNVEIQENESGVTCDLSFTYRSYSAFGEKKDRYTQRINLKGN